MMIGQLSGKIVLIRPPQVVIEVAGVGYEVDLPLPDCANLELASIITLFTHLAVREDAHLLYGFMSIDSRDCFRSLIKVSGVGPRIALALLSTLTPQALEHALNSADITVLCRTPGIGKKMAERLVLELKGKLTYAIISPDTPTAIARDNNLQYQQARNDIANALESLGFNDKDISRAMQQIPLDQLDVSSGIKNALRVLNT